jgi:hypothetical protein
MCYIVGKVGCGAAMPILLWPSTLSTLDIPLLYTQAVLGERAVGVERDSEIDELTVFADRFACRDMRGRREVTLER